MVMRSVTEVLQRAAEIVHAGPAFAHVEGLGKVERGQGDTSIGELTNDGEVHRRGAKRDTALVVADEAVVAHHTVEIRGCEIAVDIVGLDKAEATGDVGGVHQDAAKALPCAGVRSVVSHDSTITRSLDQVGGAESS